MGAAQLFEAGMLFCFGWGWPVAIIKTLRVKKVTGKSLGFLVLVITGYICGIVAKFIRADGALPDWVTWLYALNALMVAVDLSLFLKYREPKQPAAGAVTIEPEPPEIEVHRQDR